MTSPLIGGAELLERAVGYTLGSLLLIKPELLGRPTPCRAWHLKALLRHMNDSLAALHEAVDSGHVGLQAATGDPAADLVAELKDRACHLIGAWTATQRSTVSIADRQLTGAIVSCAGAVEITMHGWDVAKACGAERPVPNGLAHDLLELAELFVTEHDRPGRFAAPVPISKDASPTDRLVAFLGRIP
ncbi:TIGR03086 family metal-binding protein [Kibdelosporangium philippinense]|uniref:TIGR03086 family metal-binding protein n=1 Tax=Kibdelosporangium philippinense TaxID=211113 RepID=A0ABS8Z9R7_9PSEU|nr:TIGR03086 family metal-binding protein [Kibdelosporangium philippinense]MCE7003401.1 TIGR03086 family metal-binding protein [Kibdelosporangium philippinense]